MFVRLRRRGRIHQFCRVLPLRSSGEREEHQHLIVDAADLWSAPDLFRDSNSTGCLCHHHSSGFLQIPGVPSHSGSGCMEVGVCNVDRRWRNRTVIHCIENILSNSLTMFGSCDFLKEETTCHAFSNFSNSF